MVTSMTFASHKDIPLFPRLGESIVSSSKRSPEEHEEGWLFQRRVRCRLFRSVFIVTGQIRTVPSTVGDANSPFSLGEQHSMEVGVLAEAAASKAVRAFRSHGSTPS